MYESPHLLNNWRKQCMMLRTTRVCCWRDEDSTGQRSHLIGCGWMSQHVTSSHVTLIPWLVCLSLRSIRAGETSKLCLVSALVDIIASTARQGNRTKGVRAPRGVSVSWRRGYLILLNGWNNHVDRFLLHFTYTFGPVSQWQRCPSGSFPIEKSLCLPSSHLMKNKLSYLIESIA